MMQSRTERSRSKISNWLDIDLPLSILVTASQRYWNLGSRNLLMHQCACRLFWIASFLEFLMFACSRAIANSTSLSPLWRQFCSDVAPRFRNSFRIVGYFVAQNCDAPRGKARQRGVPVAEYDATGDTQDAQIAPK